MRTLKKKQIRKLDYSNRTNYVFIHINKCGGGAIEAALGLPWLHMTAAECIGVLGRERWDSLFSFSFVRNPWDKVVSHYHHRVKTNQTGLGENPLEFNDWVRLSYGENDPRYYDKPVMFMPQQDWLTDVQGNQAVRYIGRFESLQRDFDEVCTLLGLGRKVLPSVRKSVRSSYQSYYNPQTREIIAGWFEKDIKAYGYSF
jgi:hypothetical protein